MKEKKPFVPPASVDPDVVEIRPITRIRGGERLLVGDYILKETTCPLELDGQWLASFHCLPRELPQLAAGYCYTRGFIQSAADIDTLTVGADNTIRLQTKAGGERPAFDASPVRFSSDDVYRVKEDFEQRCELYHLTGAAHSVALADADGVCIFMEDVARHNALDKVIGEMVLQGVDGHDKVFLFSGRLALDMIDKVATTGVKLLIAPGAPTLAAVRLAEARDITMLGFVRRNNINIYSHFQRIL